MLNRHELGGSLVSAIKAACSMPFPNVLEASGSTGGMEASLDLAAREGKILVIGDYGSGKASFHWNHLLHRELDLVGSNASAGAWPEAVRLATDEKLPLARLITHRLAASRFAEGIELVRARRPDVIKAVMEWT